MKKKDLVELRNFFIEYLTKQKITRHKRLEIESYIVILDRSLQQKDPVKYFGLLLTAAKIVEELIKIIVEFLKSK